MISPVIKGRTLGYKTIKSFLSHSFKIKFYPNIQQTRKEDSFSLHTKDKFAIIKIIQVTNLTSEYVYVQLLCHAISQPFMAVSGITIPIRCCELHSIQTTRSLQVRVVKKNCQKYKARFPQKKPLNYFYFYSCFSLKLLFLGTILFRYERNYLILMHKRMLVFFFNSSQKVL